MVLPTLCFDLLIGIWWLVVVVVGAYTVGNIPTIGLAYWQYDWLISIDCGPPPPPPLLCAGRGVRLLCLHGRW